MNTSILDDHKTARTNIESAQQRANNLYCLGVTKVIELCVGPSLKVLESCYKNNGIECWGNDIEDRWKQYYKEGKWIINDAFKVDLKYFNGVVFAPPVSKGCTGKRIDSLSIEEVNPSYNEFIKFSKNYPDLLKVMVLPARSLATNFDRKQLYKLLSKIHNYEIIPLTEGRRNIRKYIDVYFK